MPPCVSKNKEHGIILITVLLFLQIASMFGLYLIQASLLSQRIAKTYWQHASLFVVSEVILKNIESKDIIEYEKCRIDKIIPYDLVLKPLDWWRAHACRANLDHREYYDYYVTEVLSSNACLKSCSEIGMLKPIVYVRITLLVNSRNNMAREFLQSIVIKLDNAEREWCDSKVDAILGRQAWRRL